MKLYCIRSILLLGVLISSSANSAGISYYAEPYLGFQKWGKLKTTLLNVTTVSNGVPVLVQDQYNCSAALGLGLRVGAQYEIYFASLDLNYFPSIGSDNRHALNWAQTQLGLTSGIQLPAVPMRFWVGFQFLNALSPNLYLATAGLNSPSALYGTSFKVGAGIRVYSPVFLNFEALFGQFSAPVSQVTISNNTVFFSLSAPLTFLNSNHELKVEW